MLFIFLGLPGLQLGFSLLLLGLFQVLIEVLTEVGREVMIDQKKAFEVIVFFLKLVHTVLYKTKNKVEVLFKLLGLLTCDSCSLYIWSYSCAIISRLSEWN